MRKKSASPQSRVQSALNIKRLTEDRRLALYLLEEVAELGGLNTYPPVPKLDAIEIVRTGSNLECVNCGAGTEGGKLYCGELCGQIAGTVRYVRGRITDGRIWKPDIQSGIGIRLLMQNGGGYPVKERKLTKDLRQKILARDGGLCARCGKPANEVDHIKGSSCDEENLRAVCGRCNKKMAFDGFRLATSEEAEFIKSMNSDIACRVAFSTSAKTCDHEAWNKIWPSIRSARVKKWRELLARAENNFEAWPPS